MTRYFLDTNILSDFVRHPKGRVAEHIFFQVGEAQVCTSIVVAAELRYGAAKTYAELVLHSNELVHLSVAMIF